MQTLRTTISKNICERLVLTVVIYCIESWIKLFRKCIGLPRWPFVSFETKNPSTYSHSYSFFYHSLSFAVTQCNFLSRVVICCHSLSLAVPLVVAHCITRCHSLCYSMSFVVTRSHSLYHLLSFVVTRSHSISLAVPIVCLFIKRSLFYNFLLCTSL